MVKRVKIKIYGRVHGVCFRYYTKKKAEELGVGGFVRNELDGSVYVEAEGEESSLRELVEWCQQGPSSAKVEKVAYKHEDKLKNFQDFTVQY